jgi:enoyl-CoA hydratase/carnithine racemase
MNIAIRATVDLVKARIFKCLTVVIGFCPGALRTVSPRWTMAPMLLDQEKAAGIRRGTMIRVARNDGVWKITIDRPEKANSLTRAMLCELHDLACDAKLAARALILTGEGKVFSAGADLDEARAGLATDPVWEELSGAIATLPCLTIAALSGTLAGGAFGMALACDLRIAVPEAKFFYPVMRLGFLPQPSDPARMAALIGPARTKMILMAGQKIGAEEALSWGLVDRIHSTDDLAAATGALCADALAAPDGHAGRIKAMIPTGSRM